MAQHDAVLAVFVAVVALAFTAQAVVMYFIYGAMKNLHQEIERIRRDIMEPVARSLTAVMEICREPVRTIAGNLGEISQVVRERATHVDSVVAELAERSRVQIVRIDQMVTTLADTVGNTAALLQRKVLTPIQEASAVAKGVRAGLEFLLARRRSKPNTGEASQDEELFI